MEQDGSGVLESPAHDERQYRRRSEADWRELLLRWAETGETVSTFCRLESANSCQFYAWRRRLQIGAVRPRRAAMVADCQAGGFVEAVVLDGGRQQFANQPCKSGGVPVGCLEVLLFNGRRIRLSGDFDSELLKRVVRSLEAI